MSTNPNNQILYVHIIFSNTRLHTNHHYFNVTTVCNTITNQSLHLMAQENVNIYNYTLCLKKTHQF